MKTEQLEEWVLRIGDRARAQQPIEDSRVELKSKWPENPNAAARRLAGHANAARTKEILWIIGIDENTGELLGADRKELANWWPQIKGQFSDYAPSLVDLNVVVGDKTVVALLFETSRIPFVVKNAKYGTPEGGAVEFEVPFREGTSVRTSRHQDLLRILVPLQALPEVELRRAEINARGLAVDGAAGLQWRLKLLLYLTPSAEWLAIPFHRCRAIARVHGVSEVLEFSGIQFVVPWEEADFPQVSLTATEITLTGPALVRLEASLLFKGPLPPSGPAYLHVELQPARSDVSLSLDTPVLQPFATQSGTRWLFEAPGLPIWIDLPKAHPLENAADKLDYINEHWLLNRSRTDKLSELLRDLERVVVSAFDSVAPNVSSGIRLALGEIYGEVQEAVKTADRQNFPGQAEEVFLKGKRVLNRASEFRGWGKALRDE